jgi:outer membrane protein TolC
MEVIRTPLRAACLIGIVLSGFMALHAAPPVNPANPPEVLPPPPPPMRITIEEAKTRALANNKLLNIGSMNVESKCYAIKVAKSNYFPHVIGNTVFLHFNDDLGTVLATQGRTITGPRGTPLVTFPATAVDLPFLNQNSEFTAVTAIQPLTDLFKVKQGVEIAKADQAIAQAQLEQGIRKVASGTEQLYWGLLFVRKIQAGAQEAVAGAEQLAQTKTVEARLALVEARQGLRAANKQAADLEEQLDALLDLPLCTHLELVEPALPELPFHCVDDVIAQALANSPELAEDSATIGKAHAAVKAGKLDYVPSVAIVGGYLNQTGMDYVQQNIGYIGVMGSYTFVDWGKRKNTIRERQMLESMASLKLADSEDKIRQNVVKTYREMVENQEALKTATEMAELRKEAEKDAKTPKDMMVAAKDRMTADVDAIKAELAYRQSVVQLMNMLGR